MSEAVAPPPIPPPTPRGFRSYLASTAFAQTGAAMQQLLVSWLLIGILLLPADEAGSLLALIGLPGILVMLWGGASADRGDPRTLLIRVYLIAPLLPLFLIVMTQGGYLNLWTITCWGLGMSLVTALTMPAQQAILSRVAGSRLQQGITIATGIGFFVQIVGLMVAGQMERIGISAVLAVQVVCLTLAGLIMVRLPAQPPTAAGNSRSAISNIIDGLRVTRRNPVIFATLTLHFCSGIFNVGALITAFPYIVKDVYAGDAWLLAIIQAVFFGSAAISTMAMWRFMPLARPARLFLIMQLTRILMLVLLWIEPSFWLVIVAVAGWGLNTGITMTMARTVVQESAEPAYRARVMSVFAIAMVGAVPVGALVLGWVIEVWGAMNSLLPAMAVSLGIFLWGVLATPLWGYRSPA